MTISSQDQLLRSVHNLGIILVMNKADIFAPDENQTPVQAARHVAFEMIKAKKAITILQSSLEEAGDTVHPDLMQITNAAAQRCEEYLREACTQYRSALTI